MPGDAPLPGRCPVLSIHFHRVHQLISDRQLVSYQLVSLVPAVMQDVLQA